MTTPACFLATCNLLGPNVLSDTCDIFRLTNLVTGAACFKSETPSLVDVLITNKPKCFSGRVNIDFGCSNFHNLIAVASRMYAPEMPTRKITYRSMKGFSDESFLKHIESVTFHVSEIFDDIDDIHWAQNNLLMSVIVGDVNQAECRRAYSRHNSFQWRQTNCACAFYCVKGQYIVFQPTTTAICRTCTVVIKKYGLPLVAFTNTKL